MLSEITPSISTCHNPGVGVSVLDVTLCLWYLWSVRARGDLPWVCWIPANASSPPAGTGRSMMFLLKINVPNGGLFLLWI